MTSACSYHGPFEHHNVHGQALTSFDSPEAVFAALLSLQLNTFTSFVNSSVSIIDTRLQALATSIVQMTCDEVSTLRFVISCQAIPSMLSKCCKLMLSTHVASQNTACRAMLLKSDAAAACHAPPTRFEILSCNCQRLPCTHHPGISISGQLTVAHACP